MISMSDERVTAVPVLDEAEPLVDVRQRLHAADRRALGDGRWAFVRASVAERLYQADLSLPAGMHLLFVEGHRRIGEQQRIRRDYRARLQAGHPELVGADLDHALDRYVAPVPCAGHLSGAAVDLTLCDDDGVEYDLGSPEAADEYESAGRCYFDSSDVPEPARSRRDILARAMTSAGFVNYPSEWWHWSYGDRYWAVCTGAASARFGLCEAADPAQVARRVSNLGRWGEDDQRGTLNLVTAAVRTAAAALVRAGEVVPMGKPIDTVPGATNPRPAWHVMHLETERPYASADSLHLQVHGFATTHLDSLGHMFLDGVGYNGLAQHDVVRMDGLQALDIGALHEGIFTRGVLLDVAAAAGVAWLQPGDVVDRQLLEEAERRGGVRVRSGDAVVVHVGLERRERTCGPEDPALRAGLDLDAVAWLHEREVAVYTGDCIERFPELDPRLPMPLHQVGIARMGLVLLDCPALVALLDASARHARSEFLLTMAPLNIPGGTGSPVNPLAVF